MTEFVKDASGETFQVFHTPAGHWRAYQVTGCERNYACIAATMTNHSKAALLREVAKHWSN